MGPKAGDEPPAVGQRHPVLSGFDESDMLPFGGELEPLRLDARVTVPLTFIPPFPGFPPEVSWMRQPKTDIPGLVLRDKGAARIAYFPAEIDSRHRQGPLARPRDLTREYGSVGCEGQESFRYTRARATRLPPLFATRLLSVARDQSEQRSYLESPCRGVDTHRAATGEGEAAWGA